MWAIHGATSVVASVLAMVVSLNIGLRGTLLVGLAWGLVRIRPAWQPRPAEAEVGLAPG